ncbi:MAG: RecX family transcriptional regulator [Tissierellia bacterium]|nr:RecX family transcriptional regulator [Tissierellia bacterium]
MKEVTKIEVQKNNPKRFNLYLDGEFFIGIGEQTLIDFKFFENKNLTEEDILSLKAREDFNYNFNRALNYLNRSMRTETELRRYMKRKEIDDALLDSICEKLKDVKMLDDKLYASLFIEEKQSANRYGKKKIEYMLRQKGVDSEIIYEALKDLDSDLDYENCLELAKKRMERMTEEDSFKKKNKLYNYLLGRGFSYDIIKDVLGELELG